MSREEIKDAIFEAIEESLEASLRAVRRLRKDGILADTARKKRKSQVEMAFGILETSGKPLHVTEIIEGIETAYGTRVDRESLVSALTKKLGKGDRFVRTGKNTFLLNKEGE